MITNTYKFNDKRIAVIGKRKRVKENRYGINTGSTFQFHLHAGKTSFYLNLPWLRGRKFGGKRDIGQPRKVWPHITR